MRVWGMTDVGLKRRENQDTFAYKAFGGAVAAVVCDGMGGVTGGRLASSLAVSTFMEELDRLFCGEMTAEQVREMGRGSIARANRAVYDRSRETAEHHGMGTTLVAAIAAPELALIFNVGDSRAYHIGASGIHRVTRDHSVVEEMVASGELTPEEARTHPNRNLITRALGPNADTECDVFPVPLAPGDELLLCTDGLSGTVRDEELLDAVRGSESGAAALDRLLELAKSRGAPDNVTAVLILNGGEEGRRNG